MLVIRADGNSDIGLGHIMRCASIGTAVKRAGERVLFVTADDNPSAFLDGAGFEHVSLCSDYRKMEDEIPGLADILKRNGAEKILIDSYFVTDSYLSELRSETGITTVYMDDMCEHAFPADHIINYNIQARPEDYDHLYEGKDRPGFILGMSYVPLRAEFENPGRSMKTSDSKGCVSQAGVGDVINIMLSTGGADPLDISGNIAAEWIKRYGSVQKYRLHIVCGPFYRNGEKLRSQVSECPNIELHFAVKNMAGLMDMCDLAFASTGSTIYELCAKGVPTISFYFVPNQRRIAEAFAEKTPVINAGDYSVNSIDVINGLFSQFDELVKDRKRMNEISKAMNELIDGCGAERIAEFIRSI